MISCFTYLQYLTFISLNTHYAPDFQTEHALAMNSGTMLRWGNRVCARQGLTLAEVNAVKEYFDHLPFRWFVHEHEAASIALLQEAQLKYIIDHPAMMMDLAQLQRGSFKPGVVVKEVISADDMTLWLDVAAKSFSMPQPSEFETFMNECTRRAGPGGLRFYVGSYKDTPAAVSVAFRHDDVVALHWVGTIPEYRRHGLGTAVSHAALTQAKRDGCSMAILFASDMGRPIYERIGFTEYARYKVFGP